MAQAEGLWSHALSVGLRRRILEEGEASLASIDPADLHRIAWPFDLDRPKA